MKKFLQKVGIYRSKLKHVFFNYLEDCWKSSYIHQMLCYKKCMWEVDKYEMNVTLWYLPNSKTIVWVKCSEMCCETASLLIQEQINKGKHFLPVWWGFVFLFVGLCVCLFCFGFFLLLVFGFGSFFFETILRSNGKF